MSILKSVVNYLLENEDKQEYIFQYSVRVSFNPAVLHTDTIKKKIDWIKDNYRELLDICYHECQTFREESFSVSREEFMESIEPVALDFYSIENPSECVITFKLGGVLEGKLITVEITKDNQVGSVLMRT